MRLVRLLPRIGEARGIGAPLELQPHPPRRGRVQVVLDREAHLPRERLRILPHQQVMVGVLQHRLGHQRRRAHAFQRRHRARALAGAVHHGGVQRHHAVGVRQAAVADAVVLRVQLVEVDAGDDGVERVGAARHPRERGLNGRHRAAVAVLVAVAGGDHHRPRGGAHVDRGRAGQRSGKRRGHAGEGTGAHEIAPVDRVAHGMETGSGRRRGRGPGSPDETALSGTASCPSRARRVKAWRRGYWRCGEVLVETRIGGSSRLRQSHWRLVMVED